MMLLVLLFPQAGRAQFCLECACAAAAHDVTRAYIVEQDTLTRSYFGLADPVPIPPGIAPDAQIGDGAMGGDETWIYNYWFRGYVVRAFQAMTDQFVNVMMLQVMAVGAQLDAKNQLSTQLLLQRLTAEAHRDYQPSNGMCVVGTTIRSLAAADPITDVSAHVLNEQSMQRQLGRGEVSGAEGAAAGDSGDRRDRLQNFVTRFCDRDDNDRLDDRPNTGLALLCRNRPADLNDLNLDVSYTRNIADPDTILLDMPRPAVADMNPVTSLQNNLFSSDVMPRMTAQILKRKEAQDDVLNARSVIAKRSVAENSYASIAGMKAMGTRIGAGTVVNGIGASSVYTQQYMALIMKDLGVEDWESEALLGHRPSYFAQLKFLAKRIYQRPEFFIDLYDTPANVARKRVAMQAINSILKRENYNSYLRSEAILSQISELHTAEKQNDVDNSMNQRVNPRQ